MEDKTFDYDKFFKDMDNKQSFQSKRGNLVKPPSKDLIMPRDKVMESSLMPPSGALLAWNEINGEEGDNNELE